MRRPPPTTSAVLLFASALALTGAACGKTAPAVPGEPGLNLDASADPDGGAPVDPDGGGPVDPALVCNVQAPTACAEPAPHFADIQPIIQERCVSCHYGAVGGPWPLILYGHVKHWQAGAQTMPIDCSMPPPDAGVRMTNEERMAILNWIRCGALQ